MDVPTPDITFLQAIEFTEADNLYTINTSKSFDANIKRGVEDNA